MGEMVDVSTMISSESRSRLEELARLHGEPLRAVARRLSRSRADAEDLVQDTLERALHHGERLEPARTWAWLVTVLNNLFIDQCRSRRRALHLPLESAGEPAATEPAPRPAWEEIGVEEVRAAMAELDEEFRAVYRMHALEGRSYDQIAAALAIPKATVGTRLLRARRKLRGILADRHGTAAEGESLPRAARGGGAA
jgi:RNA polymerase sigma-70 factor, ECF subfamily